MSWTSLGAMTSLKNTYRWLLHTVSETVTQLNLTGYWKNLQRSDVSTLAGRCPNLTHLDLSDSVMLKNDCFPEFYQLNYLQHLSFSWCYEWHPTPVLLPGKSHGRMSLVGCSSWGRWESDTTEWLHFHFSLSCIGEGNGSPLQCSCLENSGDGGAWWAAVYGIAQSRTRLKWLSSSSMT